MPGIEAIVFDFNGTLSDDEPLLARVYAELFAELGRPISETEYYEQLAGHTDEEMFTRWFGHADRALIDERIARYNRLAADGSTVDEEVRAAVRYAAGHAPVAIVSAAARSEIDTVVDATGLRDVFEVIVSQDDVTHGKPDPECYLTAARILGVAPETMLVFEDTDVGVAAAKGAGARVVGLTRTLGARRMSAADELAERIDVPLLERLLCS
ncbi:MAG TPA: HAD family phosphatase [Gaiellaceae bacterium]|nr:HAD family phosphatase [Gaiellaceae bacterium]